MKNKEAMLKILDLRRVSKAPFESDNLPNVSGNNPHVTLQRMTLEKWRDDFAALVMFAAEVTGKQDFNALDLIDHLQYIKAKR